VRISTGRRFPFAKCSTGFENLTNRKFGKQSHGENHPDHDFIGQPAPTNGLLAGGFQSVYDFFLRDDLFEARQSI
jgi:hypothetical protein